MQLFSTLSDIQIVFSVYWIYRDTNTMRPESIYI